jgi:hypothetical protein
MEYQKHKELISRSVEELSIPRAHSDIGLNAYDAFLVEHCMSLSNKPHDVVPRAFKSGTSTVHGIFYPALPDQSLHIGYLR